MALTERQIRLAKKIDQHVKSVIAIGGGDQELLLSMADYMDDFKQIINSTSSEEITELSERFTGFYRFGKLLEALAQGIQDGDIEVP